MDGLLEIEERADERDDTQLHASVSLRTKQWLFSALHVQTSMQASKHMQMYVHAHTTAPRKHGNRYGYVSNTVPLNSDGYCTHEPQGTIHGLNAPT